MSFKHSCTIQPFVTFGKNLLEKFLLFADDEKIRRVLEIGQNHDYVNFLISFQKGRTGNGGTCKACHVMPQLPEADKLG
jgi:hypothetical protein